MKHLRFFHTCETSKDLDPDFSLHLFHDFDHLHRCSAANCCEAQAVVNHGGLGHLLVNNGYLWLDHGLKGFSWVIHGLIGFAWVNHGAQ